MNDRFAGAVPYLRGFARVLGAHFHLKAAMAEGGSGKRTALAEFYIKRLLPEHIALLAHAREGAAGLYALSARGSGRVMDASPAPLHFPYEDPPAEGETHRTGRRHPLDAPAAADEAGSRQLLCAG